MKKCILSLALFLSLAVSLAAPAFAAGTTLPPEPAGSAETELPEQAAGEKTGATPVTPTVPEWIDPKDYIIFPGDEAYLPENWAKVESMREEARNGATAVDAPTFTWNIDEGTAAYRYEVGLIWLKCAENAGLTSSAAQKDFRAAARAFGAAQESWKKATDAKTSDARYCLLGLCEAQAYLLMDSTYTDYGLSTLDVIGVVSIARAMMELDLSPEDVFGGPYMEILSDQRRFFVFERVKKYLSEKGYALPSAYVLPSPDGDIQLFLDGYYLASDVPPELTNSRTMVPIRAVAEALGATVEWDQETLTATMKRAGDTVTMTLYSTTATINGKPMEMDVAPYLVNNRTLVPARYVAEFFGQKVDWDGENRFALITEDKSVAGNSNLEAWALPMGAMLAKINGGDPALFGIYVRSAKMADECHSTLDGASWNIPDRDALARTVYSMTLFGHNASFLESAAIANSLSDKEMSELVAQSTGADVYMWPYTKQLSEKWGDRGIIAWDLFRMSNLVQWGYTAGYVTYEEALTLLEPAATLLSMNFSSWDEAYENYLDGYNWWARNNVLDQDVWETTRGKYYREMKEDPKVGHIFDDALFETGVIPLLDDNKS